MRQRQLNYFFSTLLLILVGISHQSFAQATNATIKGTVKDEFSMPLMGATITLKDASTGFTLTTSTNDNGDFKLSQLPLGGPYSVSARFTGFSESIREKLYLNLSDAVTIDFILQESLNSLDEVIISSNGLSKRIDQIGASTKIGATQINKLATEGRDFTGLTSLSPLQGGGSYNLSGQRGTSTHVTIDGTNARNQLTAGDIGSGPYTISQEAIREFEVSTNDYDVTQGRQGGGSITAVTKSGTNNLSGSAFFYHRADNFQSKYNIEGQKRNSDFYTSQSGLSLGGPIIKDKLHFFAVYERQDAGEPVNIADIQSTDDENRLGITQANLDRFVNIGRNLYGLSDKQQTGQFNRKTEANNLFVRLDWQINDKHKLTVRNLYNKWDNPFSVGDNSNINMAETYSNFSSFENSTMLSLRSMFSDAITNEFKIQYQHAERAYTPNTQLPQSNIPRAIVQITSDLPNGNKNTKSVQLGGQRYTPETNVENQVQFINTTFINTDKVDFTFGTDNMITRLETLLSNEQNGRFYFSSLDEFENQSAFRYAREVPLKGLPIVKQTVLDLSLFAQMDVDITEDINFTAGVRWDATKFLENGEYNPVVDEQLGIRTDEKLSDYNNIQPRAQLTYNIGSANKNIIKLGGGIFSAQPHYYAQVNNIQNSGTLLGAIDVTGTNVPKPDFLSYRNDPNTVPGVPEGVTPFSTINAVGENFEVPTTYKANLSYTHFFGDRYSLGFNALISHTKNNYVYQEANLVNQPYFITNEGREVFVPANTINGKGQTDWTNSRISNEVGRTLLLTSDGILDQVALVLEGSAQIGKDGYLNASITFNKSQDNSSYNCCVANTSTFLPVSGDPRNLNYGYTDDHFDTKLVINGATPTWKGFTLGAKVVGQGGTRYSLKVNSNTSANGDFSLSNDIAYVYDPNDPSTPQTIIDGYNKILNDPETTEGFKTYLKESYGGFAERNGGKNPFYTVVDLRLIKRFELSNKKHGFELSVDIFNFANMLDKEWGVSHNYGNQNLMSITGFNQNTLSYDYSVQTASGREPVNGTPWRLQLGLRYTFN
ncbi:TonB-dependent receptor [Flavobacterium frigidarium]|uniref:TonB-dependent receptor n=1 Tax=Flavobacterium frigidarium TaxID=99286 RepID=UPI000421DEA7|nr:carboxypeptidase regulatory-like domain-containing protein [Flavobacterium frigidarium]